MLTNKTRNISGYGKPFKHNAIILRFENIESTWLLSQPKVTIRTIVFPFNSDIRSSTNICLVLRLRLQNCYKKKSRMPSYHINFHQCTFSAKRLWSGMNIACVAPMGVHDLQTWCKRGGLKIAARFDQSYQQSKVVLLRSIRQLRCG